MSLNRLQKIISESGLLSRRKADLLIKKSSSSLSDEPISDNDFNDAINLFKAQRKKSGISLEQLSNETKISRNVLIAIENGWKKYLPEKTYLNSMIKSLETNLNLERGSLNALSVQNNSDNNLSLIHI